ncbi:MAG: hypothetical protein J5725_04020 [Bacteroidales bacterium]|nr:hypothetical protein [Bacteroidales bacterium]
MKKVLLFFFISFFALRIFGQECFNFYYTGNYEQVDFNGQTLYSLDYDTLDCKCLDRTKFFCKGDFNIMQFERYRYGELYIDIYGFVRDIILIKVKDGFIVESYFIPCDWKEPPITAVILFSNKRIKFSKKIRLKKLELKNIGSNTVNILDDKGRLVLPKTLSKLTRQI